MVLIILPYFLFWRCLLKKVDQWFLKNNINDFSNVYAVDYNYEVVLSGIDIDESMYTDYQIIANSI